jgi:hypothetical protein
MKWKIGDWAVEGCEIVQITEMEGDQVTGLSTGFFHIGSNSFNDRLFPLTKANKVAAECAKDVMDRFHEEKGSGSLNFPDLNRKVEEFAWRLCSEPEKDRQPIYDEMSKFGRDVLDKLRDTRTNAVIGGVRIFGR